MNTPDAPSVDSATKPAPTRAPLRRPFPPEMVQRDGCPFDPPSGLRKMHEEGPISRVRLLNGAHAWVVTGYKEARAVLADARFSSDTFRYSSAMQQLPAAENADGRAAEATQCPVGPAEREDAMFIFMDAPEHTRLRRLLVGQFTVRRMKQLESHVRDIAVDLITSMRRRGNDADLVKDFALPLPSLVICELLGVDYADRAEFQDRSAVSLDLGKPDEERQRAGTELYAFMRELVVAKKQNPGDDLISGLIHGDIEPPLTERQLVDIAAVLLGAGHETTANMLALSTFALLENPGELAALRADPSLIDNSVEELLRYLSIIHTGPSRIATEDLTVGGVTVPAGDTVVVSVPLANRAPEQWAAPDRLDVTRPRAPHLAFGHGVHQCMGQQLARVELRIGLTELITRLPGLRLTTPSSHVPLRTNMVVYGVHSLPVAWN